MELWAARRHHPSSQLKPRDQATARSERDLLVASRVLCAGANDGTITTIIIARIHFSTEIILLGQCRLAEDARHCARISRLQPSATKLCPRTVVIAPDSHTGHNTASRESTAQHRGDI
ncbi:hypothetical protein BST61_g4151 [Cercospora zeina]